MLATYADGEIRNIAQRGCDRGTRGLAYYEHTCEIYRQFKDALWQMLAAEKRARAPGKLLLEWFAQETCNSAIPGSYTNDDGDMVSAEKFEQRVVWYCARLTARAILADRGCAVSKLNT